VAIRSRTAIVAASDETGDMRSRSVSGGAWRLVRA
jgi:hypothetical protein